MFSLPVAVFPGLPLLPSVSPIGNATEWCLHSHHSFHHNAPKTLNFGDLNGVVDEYAKHICASAYGASVCEWRDVSALIKNLTDIRPDSDDCLGPKRAFDPSNRLCGNDWPCQGTTMVGVVRLVNVALVLKKAVEEKVPGAFAELGVWRGGTCIFSRVFLDMLGERDRDVFVFDAFQTLPGYRKNKYFLMNSKETVEGNFRQHSALSHTHFLTGLFMNTVPVFAKGYNGQIAVLRLDGNFYDSHQDALYYLYDKVPVSGFVIFDDVMSHPAVARFWRDFKTDQGLPEMLHRIDHHSAFFQKKRQVDVDMTKMRASQDANKQKY